MKYSYTLTILAAMAALGATTGVDARATTANQVVVAAENAASRELTIKYHDMSVSDPQSTIDAAQTVIQLPAGQSVADTPVAEIPGFKTVGFLGYQVDDATGIVTVQAFNSRKNQRVYVHFLDENADDLGNAVKYDDEHANPTAPQGYQYVVSAEGIIQHQFADGTLYINVKATNQAADETTPDALAEPLDNTKPETPVEDVEKDENAETPTETVDDITPDVSTKPADQDEKTEIPVQPVDDSKPDVPVEPTDEDGETETSTQPADDTIPDVVTESADKDEKTETPTESDEDITPEIPVEDVEKDEKSETPAEPVDDVTTGVPAEPADKAETPATPVEDTVPETPVEPVEKDETPTQSADEATPDVPAENDDKDEESETPVQAVDETTPDFPVESVDKDQKTETPVQPVDDSKPETSVESAGDSNPSVSVDVQGGIGSERNTANGVPLENTMTDDADSTAVLTTDKQVLPMTRATVRGTVTINAAAVVYDSEFRLTLRVLPHHSAWHSFGLVVAPDGEVYYDLGGGQYVAIRDARMTLAALNVGETDADFKLSGVAVVDYVPHYGIQLWSNDGKTAIQNVGGSKRKLNHGSEWQVFGVVTRNGRVYYDLGGGQLIDATYVSLR